MRLFAVVVSVAMLAGCTDPSDRSTVGAVHELDLKHEIIVMGSDHDLTVSQCAFLSNSRVVVLSKAPSQLWELDPVSGALNRIARNGGGPGEIDANVCFLSSSDSTSYIHGFNNFTTQVYSGRRFLHSVRTRQVVLSSVAVNGRVFAAMHGFEKEETARRLGAEFTLGEVLETEVNGTRSWSVSQGFCGGMYYSDDEVNYYYNVSWRVLARDDETFYRVPCWGSPVVEIWNLDGTLDSTFPIPTELAHKIPSRPEDIRRELIDVKRASTLKDAKSDGAGYLHLLVQQSATPVAGSNMIVVVAPNGYVTQKFILDRQVRCFAVSPDRTFYIGVTSNDGDIVVFRKKR